MAVEYKQGILKPPDKLGVKKNEFNVKRVDVMDLLDFTVYSLSLCIIMDVRVCRDSQWCLRDKWNDSSHPMTV